MEAPVPPSAIVMSVIPVTDPPVILTLLEACVDSVPKPRFVLAFAAVVAPVPPFAKAIVVAFHVPVVTVPNVVKLEEPAQVDIAVFSTLPKPKLVLAAAAVEAPVPPSATGKSVIPDIEPPVILTLLEACVDIEPSPRLVLAVDTSVAPVPPLATAIAVPVHVPVVIVPTVAMVFVPVQVDSAMFSTLPKPTLDLDMVNHDGSEYEPVVTTPLVTVAALPLIEPLIVELNVFVPAMVWSPVV